MDLIEEIDLVVTRWATIDADAKVILSVHDTHVDGSVPVFWGKKLKVKKDYVIMVKEV